MDCSSRKKKKNTNTLITLKCSVMFSYFISASSNVFLIMIQFLTEHNYKWITLFLHVTIILLALLSFKNLINFTGKNLLRYKTLNLFYRLTFFLSCLIYFVILIYLFAKKQDQDIIIYFTLCIIVWVVFNGLFLSVIKTFIRNMEDRPAKRNVGESLIDKNLRDLILSTT